MVIKYIFVCLLDNGLQTEYRYHNMAKREDLGFQWYAFTLGWIALGMQ
jgi:hypothetical protein